jgi:magnesium transporter
LKFFIKEIWIGFSMGALIGLVAGGIAALWQREMPILGLAVGLALVVTMTLAALLGFLVPFLLIKLKADQAAGSAPIITSIKDIAGLLIYFVCVWAFMGYLG